MNKLKLVQTIYKICKCEGKIEDCKYFKKGLHHKYAHKGENDPMNIVVLCIPIPCKYGVNCTLATCKYTHPNQCKRKLINMTCTRCKYFDSHCGYIHENEEHERYEKFMEQRKEQLREVLNMCDLEFRTDSILCDDYIKGIKNNIDEIQTSLSEMKFLHEKTEYKNIFNKYVMENNMEYKKTAVEARKQAIKQYLENGGKRTEIVDKLIKKYL